MNARLGRLLLVSGVLHAAVLAGVQWPALVMPAPVRIQLLDADDGFAAQALSSTAPTPTLRYKEAGSTAVPASVTPPGVVSDTSSETPVAAENMRFSDPAPEADAVFTAAEAASDALENSSSAASTMQAEEVMTMADADHADHADQARDYARVRDRVRAAFEERKTYPALARNRGWEGEVAVRLRVEADGRLTQLRLDHSSGVRVLDEAALYTLRQVRTLPEARDWLGGRHFDMVLPIQYRLTDEQS